MIRRFPNGATLRRSSGVIPAARLGSDTQGTETSQYLEAKENTRDSLSSGERNGNSPNVVCVKPERVADRGLWGFGGGEFGPLAE